MLDEERERLIKQAAKDIVKANRVIALTGAGISTESGIPDFRGPSGLWKKYDPEEFTFSRFLSDPARFWSVQISIAMDGFSLFSAEPNPAHYALARLEELGKLNCIITQNIDGLHQKAGSKNVIEFHGNVREAVCIRCNSIFPIEKAVTKVMEGELPPCCDYCGGVLKPNAVLFGEPIPRDALLRAEEEAMLCDLMLVIGTSAVVYPAADLPRIAKEKTGYGWSIMGYRPQVLGKYGAKVIEINGEPTPLTGVISDYIIEGRIGEILPRVVEEVERMLKKKEKKP